MQDNYRERLNSSLIYIEENLFRNLSLNEIAEQAYFSAYHFHRIFQIKMGDSLMEYIKRRRFSTIIPDLLEGNKNILEIALDCGFNSHEAFTRSFKEFYNVTPSYVKKHQKNMPKYPSMVNKISWIDNMNIELDEPRVETLKSITLVGVEKSIKISGYGIISEIMKAWKQFRKVLKKYVIKKNYNAFGLSVLESDTSFEDGNNFIYFAGIDKNELRNYPTELHHRVLKSNKYLVFNYTGPSKRLRDAHDYIYSTWLPNNNVKPKGNFSFEYYTCKFGLNSRNSNIEIWIPFYLDKKNNNSDPKK